MRDRRMLVGLIGAHIEQSLAPALHADAFAAAGIDGYYHLMDAPDVGRLRRTFSKALAVRDAAIAESCP